MLANLPAKRTCRQILQLNNQTIRRKIQQKALPIALNSKLEKLRKEKSKQFKEKRSRSSKEIDAKEKSKPILTEKKKSTKSNPETNMQSNNNSDEKETNTKEILHETPKLLDPVQSNLDTDQSVVKKVNKKTSKVVDTPKNEEKETEELTRKTRSKTGSADVSEEQNKSDEACTEDDESSQTQKRTLRSSTSPKEPDPKPASKPKKGLLKKVQAKAKKVVENLGRSLNLKSKKVELPEVSETAKVEEVEKTQPPASDATKEPPATTEDTKAVAEPTEQTPKVSQTPESPKVEPPKCDNPLKTTPEKIVAESQEVKGSARRRNRKNAAPRPITRIIQAEEDDDLIPPVVTPIVTKYQENVALNLVRKETEPLPVQRTDTTEPIVPPIAEVIPTACTELTITVTPPIAHSEAFTPNSTSMGEFLILSSSLSV